MHARLAWLVAADVPDADKDRMQQAVIDSADPKYAYLFARDVADADIDALSKIVALDRAWLDRFKRDVLKTDGQTRAKS